MLRFFEGESTDDLDERFDEIARNPHEFRTWLRIATSRVPATHKLELAVDVAIALYSYMVKGLDIDDEYIEEANAAIAETLRRGGYCNLTRSLHDVEHNASSPFNFFGSRALEDVRDAAEVSAP